MEFNYYQILGIPPTADQEQIKAAYKELAKKYHPDKNVEQEFYSEYFKKISEAYSVLSKPDKRKKYDLKILYGIKTEHKQQKSYPPPSKPSVERIKKKKPFLEKSEYKLFALCGAGLLVLVVLLMFFNSYMNRYTAKTYYNEGLELEKNKVYIAALGKYSEAIGFNKEYSEAYAKRGTLRMELLGDEHGSLNDLSLAIHYAENSPAEIYFSRAKLYLNLEKYEEALKDFETSVSLNPELDSAYYFCAEIFNYTKKEYKKAISNYSKVIAKNPQSYESFFGRGFAYQNTNNYQSSLADFSAAISITPEKGYYYYYRGISKLELKDTLGACVDWDQAKSQGYQNASEQIKNHCSKHLN